MNPRVQWDSLRALFEGALERSPADRSAFIRAHTDDEGVRREVESLLAAHEQAGGFLMEAALGPGRGDSAPVNEPRLPAGRRLGAFEIVGVVGSGGMGEVYRARDTRLDRFVAIKVLSRAIHDAHGGRERFEREARAISRLSHPHICTIYDVGAAQVDGQEIPFLVLELLEGETLATRLARGPLSIADAVSYAVEMADALASAHAKGIVHRDLKPSNVMLTGSGIKLLDFGLARLYAPEVASDGGATRSEDLLTSAGRVIGTAPYMSPEQVEGGTIDARSDIFSFGSVLYELLTGRRAFPGDSGRPPIAQILRTIHTGEQPRSGDSRGSREHRRAVPAQGPGAPLPEHGGREGGARRRARRVAFGTARADLPCRTAVASRRGAVTGLRGHCRRLPRMAACDS